MSFYNGILNHDDNHESSQGGQRGLPGIGYKLTSDGDYDIQNKKLTNVKLGDADNDVMVKNQIEGYVSNKTQYIDDINPGQVKSNKAVIYSNTGSIHSNSLYLKDQYGQETIFHNEDQDDNQIRLYIPNLKNNDSFGGRLKSSLVITSLDQIIEGRKVFHNIEVPNPAIDSQACNRAFVLNELSKISDNYVRKSGDAMIGSLIVPKDNYPIQGNLNKVLSYETQREIFLSKREGGKMLQPIDMNGFSIDNLPLPTAVDHASTKGYTDNKVDSKANKSDLNDYMKLDGSKVMTGTLNMNNNRITNLPSPHLSTEPATKDYVTTVMNHLPSLFVDRQGKSKMLGNLDINQHKIINVIEPTDDLDVSNKLYTDNQIIKSNIKPNSIPKNAFKYLMDDVNEWSSEYNIKVLSFSDLSESPHSWNKRILNITPLKDDDNNYRFRLGIQCFSLDNNKEYTLAIELYNKDYETWKRQLTYINADTAWIESYHTQKFQHHYQENGDIYYTKTLIKFKKTSTSTPNFIYITYHFDDNGGDMSTYPKEFANQVYILAYGSKGLFNHLDSAVYDKHQAFEIEKTKMKMLVDLDINNKLITNIGSLNMNNNNIKNIGNISNNNIISIYGTVNEYKYFTSENAIIEFGNIKIKYIRLYNQPKLSNKSDTVHIYITNNEERFDFQYKNIGWYTHIIINRFYNVVSSIKLKNNTNVTFQLGYELFY